MVGGRIASELPSNAARMSVSGAQVAPGRAVSARGATAGEVSGGLAVIGFQQSAQTLNANDLALVSFMLCLSSGSRTALERLDLLSNRLSERAPVGPG